MPDEDGHGTDAVSSPRSPALLSYRTAPAGGRRPPPPRARIPRPFLPWSSPSGQGRAGAGAAGSAVALGFKTRFRGIF